MAEPEKIKLESMDIEEKKREQFKASAYKHSNSVPSKKEKLEILFRMI